MDQVKSLMSKRKSRRLENIGLVAACLILPIASETLVIPDHWRVIQAVFSPIFLLVLCCGGLGCFAGLWVSRVRSDLTPEQRARVAAGE